MKVKTQINYKKLVKSSRDLLLNKNFRNNQNYIISDFSKFNFFSKYYRSWLSKNAVNIVYHVFIFMICSIILIAILNDSLKSAILLKIGIFIFVLFLFIVSFVLLFMLYDRFIYYFYKKFSFIKRKHIFKGDRYIFLKTPGKSKYILNRRNFISFKK